MMPEMYSGRSGGSSPFIVAVLGRWCWGVSRGKFAMVGQGKDFDKLCG